MHVGLNLIFLVPGETGGMEIAARELIPVLLAEAPPEMRFTAFVNREAAATGRSVGELLPSVTVPVNADNRVRMPTIAFNGRWEKTPRRVTGSDRALVQALVEWFRPGVART
jgi:hypothetical protein